MSHKIDSLWSQMLGKKRPSKEIIKQIESSVIQDIEFTSDYVVEQHNTIIIKYKGTAIAGLLPSTKYQELTPWGNFEKWFSQDFWENLASKLAVSYRSSSVTLLKKENKKSLPFKQSGIDILEGFCVANESKSNRSGSDYSELMVVKNLCEHFNCSFNYESELQSVTKKMLSMPGGIEKKQVQDRNIPQLVKGCLSIFTNDPLLGSINRIIWTGRSSGGTEDLVAEFTSKKVRVSLKSIKLSGAGTLKNAGAATFNSQGLLLDKEYEEMKDSVRSKANEKFPELVQEKSTQSEIKTLAKEHDKLRELADEVSAPFLKKINYKIFELFKGMTVSQLKSFIREVILDTKTVQDPIWVCLVNEKGLQFWNQSEEYGINENDIITVDKLTDKGFKILKNGKSFIRANTCCTNGKGLSAVCQRYFYDDSSVEEPAP